MRPRVIPCLLLDGEDLVKTERFRNERYVGDPINTVRLFNEKEVDELVLLDITATTEGRPPNLRFLERVAAEAFMPLAYGGGIQTLEQGRAVLRAGFEKVVVQAAAAKNKEILRELADEFGRQAVVASIDLAIRRDDYEVRTHRGRKAVETPWLEYLSEVEEAGAGEILLTSIDREGTAAGFDLAMVAEAARRVSIPVVAHGGAGNLDHFASVIEAGASAAAAGRFFIFWGNLKAVLVTYPPPEALDRLGSQLTRGAL